MSDSRKNGRIQGEKSPSGARIFIVEDEIVIVRGLQQALGRNGYNCCGFAMSGEEALAAIAVDTPDLVLVDIYLKGAMDGIELAEAIRSSHAVPVVFLTAYSNQEILRKAKCTDPYGYIVKPFRERQLKVNIELALERQRLEKEKTAFLEACRKTIQELEDEVAGKSVELSDTRSELDATVQELGQKKMKLDELRRELQEVSNGLRAIATHVARTREEMELEVAVALRSKVLPILKQLHSDPEFKGYRTEFDMLSMHLGHLSSAVRGDSAATSTLSTTELRIAVLIKNGLSSELIAQDLHVSLDTIKTHRRNIRKKFGLQNSKTNLSTYLMARWAGTLGP